MSHQRLTPARLISAAVAGLVAIWILLPDQEKPNPELVSIAQESRRGSGSDVVFVDLSGPQDEKRDPVSLKGSGVGTAELEEETTPPAVQSPPRAYRFGSAEAYLASATTNPIGLKVGDTTLDQIRDVLIESERLHSSLDRELTVAMTDHVRDLILQDSPLVHPTGAVLGHGVDDPREWVSNFTLSQTLEDGTWLKGTVQIFVGDSPMVDDVSAAMGENILNTRDRIYSLING